MLRVNKTEKYQNFSSEIFNFNSCKNCSILHRTGLEVIKLFSCSSQLSLKFILFINMKMPKIVGILTFISRINDQGFGDLNLKFPFILYNFTLM